MGTADAGRCCHSDFEVIVRTLPRRFVPQHLTSSRLLTARRSHAPAECMLSQARPSDGEH